MDLIATSTRLPLPGETLSGDKFFTSAGGKGANQALAVQRAFGRNNKGENNRAQVEMVGCVGSDEFSKPALSNLVSAGVDLKNVQIQKTNTGTALILVGTDGENMIVVVPGANGLVDEKMAHAAVENLNRGDYLLLQLEVPAPTINAALLQAREKGVTSILNIAPLIDEAAELASLADIVVANETEFERLTGVKAASKEQVLVQLKKIHEQTKQTMVITLGADGVVAANDGEFFEVSGLEITPINTVGAGDTFCGYFASGLADGLDFEKSLKRAAVAGSLACLKEGAQPAIPWLNEVEATRYAQCLRKKVS